MNITEKIDMYLGEGSSNRVSVTCMECGKKFMHTFKENKEVKCPKCHSTDVEPD